jgi:hypothetical protein
MKRRDTLFHPSTHNHCPPNEMAYTAIYRNCPSSAGHCYRNARMSPLISRHSSRHPGRDARYRAPPGQIRACAANALGSHLGCLTRKRFCGQACAIWTGSKDRRLYVRPLVLKNLYPQRRLDVGSLSHATLRRRDSLWFGSPQKSAVFHRVFGRGVDLAGPGMPEILSLEAVSLPGVLTWAI